MPSRGILLGLALGMLTVMALPARPAQASCAMPTAFFAGQEPGADGKVPVPAEAPPVLYFFDPAHRWGGPLGIGSPDGRLAVDVVSETPAFRVYKVAAAEPRRVKARWRVVAQRGYPSANGQVTRPEEVARGWLGPTPPRRHRCGLARLMDRVEIKSVTPSVYSWTCSHQQAQVLVPSVSAPAYRVVWATSAEAYRRGEVKTVVLPRTIALFFGQGQSPSPGRLPLGFCSCFGETLEWPTVNGRQVPIHVGIEALFADGREGPAPAGPTLVPPPLAPERVAAVQVPVKVQAPPAPPRSPEAELAMRLRMTCSLSDKVALRAAYQSRWWRQQILEGVAGFGAGFSLVQLAALGLAARRRRARARACA